MTSVRRRGFVPVAVVCALAIAVFAAPVRADEIWVAPTAQQDFGGLGIASNTVWPATAFGVVRLALSVPDNLNSLQSAKVVLIPHSPAGPATLNIIVCSSKNGDVAIGNCAGPISKPFVGVANVLMEVEIAGFLAPFIGSPGANYLAVIAYTTPTAATDHIIGLRFGYEPTKISGVATLAANTFSGTQTAPAFVGNGSGLTGLPFPAGAATLGANTFSGTQTAPAFAGNGSGLTNLPFPSDAATLGANTFSGTQTAPAFVGNGSGLTNLPFPSGAATLGANTFSGTQTAPAFAGSGMSLTGVAKLGTNTFTGTQTIEAGHLDLDTSTVTTGMITKNGTRFLHNFGANNTFLGLSTGNLTMTGGSNTAIGQSALTSNTTGSQNTANGKSALENNSAGAFNTATGLSALIFNTTGSINTASGASALHDNFTGSNNTASGVGALFHNTTGNSNTAFGNNAGFQATTGSNNIYLGANVNGIAGESDAMYLGNGQTKTVVAGIRGITTGAANAIPVVIDSNGQLGTVSSSIRFKEDIHDMADISRRLLQLRPVTFRYTQAYQGGAKPIQYGLIAEEVADVFPELAVRGADGQVETVHYETLNVLLLNELQKQQAHLDEQSEEQQKQARRIEALEQQLNELLLSKR